MAEKCAMAIKNTKTQKRQTGEWQNLERKGARDRELGRELKRVIIIRRSRIRILQMCMP